MKKEFYLLALSLGLIFNISAMEPEEQREGWLRQIISYFFVKETSDHEVLMARGVEEVSQPNMPEASALPDKIKFAICNHEPETLKEYFKTTHPDKVIIEMPMIAKASNNAITMMSMNPMTFYFEDALFESNPKSVAVLKTLLAAGADPNSLLLDKKPILFKAAQKDVQLVQLLLEKGANPFICDGDRSLLFNSKLDGGGGELLRNKARERNGDKFDQITKESCCPK
jgi:hypothetical protein